MARTFRQSDPGDILGSLIKDKMQRSRLTAADMAKSLYISRSTFYTRMGRPTDFTYLELHLMFRALLFTPGEILMVMSPSKLYVKGK
jgi:hypothetical protein